MRVEDEFNSRELVAKFKISRTTLSRWVSSGCPHMKVPGAVCAYQFKFSEVLNWLKNEGMLTEEGYVFRFKSHRRLKRYYLFSVHGKYVTEISGSRELVAKLRNIRDSYSIFPYALDKSGEVFVYYSGKLRNHDTAGKGGAAAFYLPTKYPAKLKEIVRKIYRKYLPPGNYTPDRHEIN